MHDTRYIRQTLLEKIGEKGQLKLLNSRVCIIGCGGLGSIIAPYLAGAGVGELLLIDGDMVELSNLHRQVIFNEKSQGKPKAKILARHCLELNPSISVSTIEHHIKKSNINSFIQNCDVVVECTDEIYTKYLVNDYCHLNKIPMVYGAIYKYDGYVSLFENKSKKSIHLRDIFPSPQNDLPTCSEVGVLATIAGLTAVLQANEVIKFITNIGESLVGKLLSYSVLENKQMTLKLRKSFKEDMLEIYEKSSYNDYESKEISWEDVEKNKGIKLVCILEKEEEYSLDLDHIKIPFSEWEIHENKLDKSKSYAIFCKSGKRAKSLVKELNGAWDIFSVKGGINNYPK